MPPKRRMLVRYAGGLTAACFSLSAASQAPTASPSTDQCATNPAALGVSRVVDVDATDGPQFGNPDNRPDVVNFLEDGEVLLTFDDGPLRPYTRAVLKALARHCTKATFFMVGRMAVADPVMVKEVADAGHTVATHTWSHRNLRPLGLIKGKSELELGVSAVAKGLGRAPAPFFRFPYLSGSRSVETYVKSRHIATFWIDVDSKDYLTRDPKLIHKRVMSELASKRKGIILMHDIQPSTAHAIDGLLDDLKAKGFKIVHAVTKQKVETIAEYDVMAEKEFAAKQLAASANPLASRALTWTAGGDPTANRAARKKAAPSASSDSGLEILPWLAPPAKPASGAAGKPQSSEPPWQPSIFGF